MSRFFLITGGPGAGKSTLLEALRAAGYPGFEEAGRALTRLQWEIGGNAHHTGDTTLYAELSLAWDLRSYREAERLTGPVFFDRGVPDDVTYYPFLGKPVPAHVARAGELFRYHPVAFIAPPWAEIYAGDAERKQDFAEAVASYEALVEGYRQLGYDLLELPRADVASRVSFVLDTIGRAGWPAA